MQRGKCDEKNSDFIIINGISQFEQFCKAATTHGRDGQVSGRSVGAALCSLLVWPGIGQAINKQSKEKNVTHAVLGLTGVFRFWSFYDAIIDRQGGVWKNRI